MFAIQTEVDLPYVDMCFGLVGRSLPADHGYGLYSAIAHLCPQLHQQDWLSIQTVMGIPDGQGKIYLTDKSRLRIRLPGDQGLCRKNDLRTENPS